MLVEDEEVITVGALNFGDRLRERIIEMKVLDVFVEVFVSAVGVFDFEGV